MVTAAILPYPAAVGVRVDADPRAEPGGQRWWPRAPRPV